MAFRFVKRNVLYLGFLGFLALASCESNTSETLTTDALSQEETKSLVFADDIASDVDDVVEDEAKITEDANRAVSSSNHPDCLERTVEETATGKIVTLDFGEGCEGKKGRIYAGKMIIEYTYGSGTRSKVVSFENFSVNGNAVEGGIAFEKVRENANGNPERAHSIDLTITLTTGEEITKKGEKVKEKIEGADTPERGDDVVLISGYWESVKKDGTVKKSTITTSLRREYACKFIVSGIVEITKGEKSYTLDFGDGSCDNKATLTDENGESKVITLKDRRRR